MKKLLAPLLVFAGLASAASPPQKLQTIDPKSILFTTPTLSNDIAELESVTAEPTGTDLVFHEDEWSQVEFFSKDRLAEIQAILREYNPFEQAHRAQYGWREVYVRRIQRSPVVIGAQPVQQLERLLGAKAAAGPVLFSASTVSGRVKNGFSLSLGEDVSLYGYVADQSIPVLGANVGNNPDNSKLTEAFMKLNTNYGLILVDWRAQLVLVSVATSGQIKVWRP